MSHCGFLLEALAAQESWTLFNFKNMLLEFLLVYMQKKRKKKIFFLTKTEMVSLLSNSCLNDYDQLQQQEEFRVLYFYTM